MYEESSYTLPDPDRRYWRRRANRRVRKARRARLLLRGSGILLLNVGILSILAFSGSRAVRHLKTSPEFALDAVTLEGAERCSPEAVRARLADLRGTNLWALDLEDVAARVRRDPWVLDCSVKRVLPHTLRISIVEREPAARARMGERDWVVDRRGVVIGPGDGSFGNLPLLVGLDRRDRGSLDEALRRGAGAVVRLRETAGTWVDGLAHIDLSRDDRIEAAAASGPRVLLDPDRVERNLADYLAMKGDLDRRIGRTEYVDLRWRDRIAVMPEPVNGE